MRFLIDPDVLTAATFEDLVGHEAALHLVQVVLGSGRAPWCLTWDGMMRYLAVSTDAEVFEEPLSWDEAAAQAEGLLQHPSLTILTETERHLEVFLKLAAGAGGVSGDLLMKCHVAAVMVENDVPRIVTLDEDYGRFEGIEAVPPEKLREH